MRKGGVEGQVGEDREARSGVAGLEPGRLVTALLLPFLLSFLSLTGTPEAPGMTAGGVHVGVDGVDGVAGVVGLKTDARSGVAGLERGRFATALLLPFSPFFSFTGTPEAPAIAAGGVGGVAGAPGAPGDGVEPDKSIRLGHCTRVTRKKYGGAS